MNLILTGIGLVIAGVIAAFQIARSRDDKADLGTVSGQWLAEHRQSQES